MKILLMWNLRKNNMSTREGVIKEGYKYYCVGCKAVYKEIPRQIYEDGHGGRYIVMCKNCEDTLICNLMDDRMVKDD